MFPFYNKHRHLSMEFKNFKEFNKIAFELLMRFETPKNNSTEKYIESNELLRKNSYPV